MAQLGVILKNARLRLNKTLRDIESVSGISNGYLSQLESDAVKQPSPHHLHALARIYGLEYAALMEAAGYAVARQVAAAAPSGAELVGLHELSAEERQKIQAYIDDLRLARLGRSIAAPHTTRDRSQSKKDSAA